MLIGGLQKLSLLDYPDKLCAVIFTIGCNFRCPFCYNVGLVDPKKILQTPVLSEQEVFEFLKKRIGLLDAVCITGGEPTIQSDLSEFAGKIKALGFLLKIDTNGSNPKLLRKLVKGNLVDYLAIDVKFPLGDCYGEMVGVQVETDSIKKSINAVRVAAIPFELRTTVVPALHTLSTLSTLAEQIKKLVGDTNPPWYLQQFFPRETLDPKFSAVRPYPADEMQKILFAVQKIYPDAKLRGA